MGKLDPRNSTGKFLHDLERKFIRRSWKHRAVVHIEIWQAEEGSELVVVLYFSLHTSFTKRKGKMV